MDDPVHARAFVGYIAIESLGGPDVDEEYEPLCGADPEDAAMDDWSAVGVTCKECLRLMYRTDLNTKGN